MTLAGVDVQEAEQVVLEQFIASLPAGTAEWVQCHQSDSLVDAMQQAEDHMSAFAQCISSPLLGPHHTEEEEVLNRPA